MKRFNSSHVTWQGDALLVARFPLAVLVHSAALAAGFLVAHERGVVLGANFILRYGSLGKTNKQASTLRTQST